MTEYLVSRDAEIMSIHKRGDGLFQIKVQVSGFTGDAEWVDWTTETVLPWMLVGNVICVSLSEKLK